MKKSVEFMSSACNYLGVHTLSTYVCNVDNLCWYSHTYIHMYMFTFKHLQYINVLFASRMLIIVK